MLFRRRAHCGSLAADEAVCPKVRYNYTSSRLEVHARLDKVQLRKLCPAFDIKLVQERPHLARSSTYQAQKKFGGFSNYFTISELKIRYLYLLVVFQSGFILQEKKPLWSFEF